MTDLAPRLARLDTSLFQDLDVRRLASVINALAGVIDHHIGVVEDRISDLEARLDELVDVLELDIDGGVWREIVDVPDIATYQPEEAQP